VRVKLTLREVKARRPDPRGRFYLWDTELVGFGMVVYPSGRRAFVVQYYLPDGREQRYTLSKPFGVATIEEAREEARQLLAGAKVGLSPLVARQEKRGAMSVAAWIDEYLADVVRRKRSARDDRHYLGIAREKWGRLLLTELTSKHVSKVFQAIAASGKRTAANRFLASVRACLQAAWRLDLISSNPAAKVRALPEGAPRSRVLSEAELGRLVKAVDALKDPHVRAAFVLLIVTGCRLSEVLRAKWEDVDLDGGLWRIPRAKSGRVEVIPLPGSVVALLRTLPRVGSLVVPGCRDPDKRRPDLSGPWDKLRKAARLEGVHVHDLRRTAGLAVARSAGLHVASRYLRHSDIRVTQRHYAPLGIDELRRAAEVQTGPLAKVLPMPEKRARKRGAK